MIKVVDPSVKILTELNYQDVLYRIERAGRTCYKSESDFNLASGEKFAEMIIKKGHESVLEHEIISVSFIGSRTMSHQLVRHRLASYSQESQRYCNYNRYEELEIVIPRSLERNIPFRTAVMSSYIKYKEFIADGIRPEDARAILPNCTKTELVVTMNIRQWRHFFRVRCDKHAQEEIRTLATTLLNELKIKLPILFKDLY